MRWYLMPVKPRLSGGGQVRLDVIEIEVEADVPVEIAVAGVAGVAFVPAPDLAGGIGVAAEGGDAVGGEDGRKGAVTRARAGVQEAVACR